MCRPREEQHENHGLSGDGCGDNIAFCCFECAHPILAVALKNQRGSDEDHPAVCRGCAAKYFLDVREHAEKLYIQTVEEPLW
jgi:hypothetical protein